MFEHVGRKFYKKFFNQISNLLNNDGLSLIHTIGSVNHPTPLTGLQNIYFRAVILAPVSRPYRKIRFNSYDIEVLRTHYAHTLRHWTENCIKNKQKIIEMFDDKFLTVSFI